MEISNTPIDQFRRSLADELVEAIRINYQALEFSRDDAMELIETLSRLTGFPEDLLIVGHAHTFDLIANGGGGQLWEDHKRNVPAPADLEKTPELSGDHFLNQFYEDWEQPITPAVFDVLKGR